MRKRLSSVELVKEKEDSLMKLVETSIYDLTKAFFSNPYLFYTENDLHCYLYKLLLEGLEAAGHGLYETVDGRLSILLHKEYPTKKRYSKKLLAEKPTGARGHFDLSLWNPENVSKRLFRSRNSKEISNEQQTLFAFELLLVEGTHESTLTDAVTHTKWDILKLRENEVKHGYILIFARDWSFREGFLKRIKEMKIPSNTSLVYAENSNGQNVFEKLGK